MHYNYWTDENKTLNILSAINEGFDAVVEYIREDKVSRLVEIYENLQVPQSPPKPKYSSALIPSEPIREYRPPIRREILERSDVLVDILADKDFSIAAIDSGIFTSGPHILIDIAVINVGFWYINYRSISGGGGNRAKIYVDIEEGTRLRTITKDMETEVIKELIAKLFGKKKFVLLDESFSLSYTLSWSEKDRLEMVSKVVLLIDEILNRGSVPIGIFYTRTHDIVRGISTLKPNIDIPRVPDRALMNKVLNTLSRSPTFRVYSKALEGSKLEILAFYVKMGEGNILRVEFPKAAYDLIDDIYLVVITQSILGGGYPLALQRAHDWAVIDAETREIILGEICRRLGIPLPDMIYSRKLGRKISPIE